MARRCARAGTPTKIKNLCDHQWYDEEAKKVMVCATLRHACGVAYRLCTYLRPRTNCPAAGCHLGLCRASTFTR
jgi:hypothetical protein